ncbi:MAG: Ig-like domain-containing protein [Prevotella sp.]|nr:Ig-like domain-containing protein [Prevotella sp.]
MKKTLLTLAMLALALTSAQASVVINATNFPDEKLRASVLDYDYTCDNDGVLSDEEIENCREMQAWGAKNLKGLELLPNLEIIILNGDEESYSSITSFDAKPFKNLRRFDINNYAITSLDLTYSNNLGMVEVNNCRDFSAIKTTSNNDYVVYMINLPKLTDMSACDFKNARGLEFKRTGIQDIDVSNYGKLEWLRVAGDYDAEGEMQVYELNSINVAGCDILWELGFQNVKLQSVSLSELPRFYALQLFQCETKDLSVVNMPNLGDVVCSNCSIENITIKNCPVLNGVGCADNNIKTLIIDDSPILYTVKAENNQLMWLDMQYVNNPLQGQNWFMVDNQQPRVQAVKISPTETGLLVHSRFDVSRVLNLRAKGLSQTPRETTVDGIRYFVFYDDGPDTPNLVGSDCGYVYETKWPYPWMDENSKDNNLPVTLNVTSWTKHQAFLTLSESRVEGKYGEPAPAAPTVTRSQDYDGKITFSSSDESVVKVDPDTGVLTVVGAGTVIISVKGAETDYRLAPAVKTYTVYIEKATPVIVFPATEINAVYGETVPLNQLTVTWYEGTVTYASANEKKATVTAEGVVTTKGAGDVIIKGIAPETRNFKRGEVTYVLHIDKARPAFSFAEANVTAVLGEAVPENKLTVGLYDGEVTYASSDEAIAMVDANGVVTTKAPGQVIITATGAETENCYEAQKAQYSLTVTDPSGIGEIVNGQSANRKYFDLQGRRIISSAVKKGMYVVDGKKVIVK